MKTIPLTKGLVALVDDEDYERVNKYKWSAHLKGKAQTYYYAEHAFRLPDGGYRNALLHRFILGLTPGDARLVDHKNHNTLDCRRENLRTCDRSQNRWNSRRPKTSAQKLKGVSRYSAGYYATLCYQNRQLYLGTFPTEQLAHAAYCKAAAKLFGEFACFR